MRVVIVEDQVADAVLMERELRRANFEFTARQVMTRAEFEIELRGVCPDVVLSDHNVPQFGAMQALEMVRRLAPQVPVIVVTGSVNEETAVEYLKSGAADYVLKDRLSRLGPAVASALDRRHMREAHQQAEAALRESEERFRQMAEHIKEAFFVIDLSNWRPLYISPTWAEIWGRPVTDAYANPQMWFETIHPDDRATMRADQERSIRGEPTTSVVRVVRPDGSVRWVRGRAFPVRNVEGRVYRMVGVSEDITELRRAEEQMAQAQKMEAVGRLAGGVAHDFNNLLTVILGETEIAQADLAPGHPLAESLAEVRRAGERAAVLTRQLLAFSRRQLVEPTVFPLNGVVVEMTKMLRRLIGEDLELVVKMAPDAGAVRMDRGQIEQVLANLVVNARDAMPGGGTLTIETQNVQLDEDDARGHGDLAPGRYVFLAVSDTGAGMTDDVKARAFEPFFTTKEQGKGTGLGLATCYGIVKQAGGHIAVYSEVGVGTTMKVYLPLVGGEVGTRETVEATALPRGTETVLVVEDEGAVRRVAVRVLQGLGYGVVEARDRDEALRVLEVHPGHIDLLLTDVVLPGIGGRELADRVTAARPGIKVLFTSGYTADVILQHRLLEHDVALLQKPFTRESLARKVRDVLDG